MEVLILIIGLMAFFESDLKDVDVAKNIKTVGYNQTILVKEVINQNDKFEITNKKGVWMFTPAVNKNQKKVIKETESSKFITLPDGSKIEQGL